MNEVRIATRRSRLAMAQAEWVASALRVAHPGLSVSLVEVTTTGDVDRTSPVAALTEVGAFVRAVQEAVLDGRADLAVHSCKDLPVAGPPELQIVAFPRREAPWDVLCGSSLIALPERARVGTGSPRRTAQLRKLRPDLIVDEIRGNVDTRLAKVEVGEFDAIVLAEAGLRRLGLEGHMAQRFDLDEMVPAPAQAALAVEAIAGSPAGGLAQAIDDQETRSTVTVERDVLARTGAGCRAALGVHGSASATGMTLVGFVDDGRGDRRASVTGLDPAGAVDHLIRELGLAT